MKAITYTEYGSADVLRLVEAEKPVPTDDEVLIRIRAASLNAYDLHMMRGRPWPARFMAGGLRMPKDPRPGRDVAGEIEAVGRGVTQFQPGDEVFGFCRGSLAEYACAKEATLARKPANVSFEDASAVPMAAITALQGLRDKGRIRQGQQVLIDGASGGVGTFAVRIARSFGAEVTAVCSTRNADIARSLGADHVIDYTHEDFTKSANRYDLIFGANAHRSIFDYRRALGPGGIYVMSGGGGPQIFQAMLLAPILSRLGSRKFRLVGAKVRKTDLDFLKELLAAGKITPVIDRRYPLSEAPEAMRYLEQGHARGKVVVTM